MVSKEPEPNFISYWVRDLNHFVRKAGHAWEFMILAIFTVITLRKTTLVKKAYLISILICVLYAILDEFHQSYVPGRTPLLSDILIDFCGAVLGLSLVGCWIRFKQGIVRVHEKYT